MSSKPNLTCREVEILRLVCEGLANKEIAQRLQIATRTVEAHREKIYRRMLPQPGNVVQLLRVAVLHGFVECPCKACEAAPAHQI